MQEHDPTGRDEGADDAGGFSIGEMVDVLLRHVWVSLLVVAVVAAAGWWVLSKRPAEYRAEALLLLSAEQETVLPDLELVEGGGRTTGASQRDFLRTQVLLLGSRDLAAVVASRLALGSHLRFLGLEGVEDAEELQAAIASIDVVQRVQNAVSIEPVRDSSLIRIVVVTRDPDVSMNIANAIATVYVEQTHERQVSSLENAEAWLNQQHASLKTNLEASERAMLSYRRDNNVLAVRLTDNVSLMAEMQTVSAQLADARLEVDRLRTTVAQIQRVLDSGNLVDARLDAVTGNVLIQDLRRRYVDLEIQRLELLARYLPGHPDVQNLAETQAMVLQSLEAEITKILTSHVDRFENARDLERRLAVRLEGVERRVQELGGHEVEYRVLERDAEANRELFRIIERRLKEVELVRSLQQSRVTIAEEARRPAGRWDPRRQSMLIALALLALACGVGAAFGLEMLDTSVKSTDSVLAAVKVPFVGAVPVIRPSPTGRRSSRGPARGEKVNDALFSAEFPRSDVAEACRSVRTSLMFLSSENELRRILVTSASPQDGKTTTTANLGIVMAQSGTRVLVIDTDLRRPRLHVAFNLPHEVGLSSVLTREVTAEQAIQSSGVENLDVLVSGPIPSNPTELMLTERFRDVIDELTEKYDRVIFDSPPTLPVTDSAILSGFVDGVIFVARSGRTSRHMLKRAVASLRGVRANILGVVLNGVDYRKYGRVGSGYYGYYYARSQSYYGPAEEEESTSTS